MTTHRQNIWFASWLVMASATAFLPAGAQELPPADLPPGVEILGRGPIHEAFAEPILFDDTPALIAPRQPPQMVRELPPENQPAGDSVIWIPGYWSWDEERNDFIWVSGIWRQAPPGRRWLPGYWTAVENGYRWWPGSWIEEAQRDIAYLPAPPDSLEIGPASPPPGDEFAWIPGCWQWIDEEQAYVWQPGSWQILPDAFVWVPAHYCYTPQGAVFVSAYRDYPFEQRGIMFAPVWYEPAILADPTFAYCPSFQLILTQISSCLFVQPRSCHYYFGDYFNRPYRHRGFYPCHTFSVAYRGYDPLFGYLDGRASRRHRERSKRVAQNFDRLLATPTARPAKLLASSSQSPLPIGGSRVPKSQFARRVDEQLTRIDDKSLAKPQRAEAMASALAVRAASQTRAVSEGKRRTAGRTPIGVAADRHKGLSVPVTGNHHTIRKQLQGATNRQTQVVTPFSARTLATPTWRQQGRRPTQTGTAARANQTGNNRRALPPTSNFQMPSRQPQVPSFGPPPAARQRQMAKPVQSPLMARGGRRVQSAAPPAAKVRNLPAAQPQPSVSRQRHAGGASNHRSFSRGHGGKGRK